MTELRTAHTADLGPAELAAIRGLMDAAFDGVSDDIFDNTLGGVHALILEGARAERLWRGPTAGRGAGRRQGHPGQTAHPRPAGVGPGRRVRQAHPATFGRPR